MLIWWWAVRGCASARARLIGRCVKAAPQPWMEELWDLPSFLKSLSKYVLFFFLLLSDKWMAQKKSKYQKKCIALHNGIPWARTRNNGPFSASCAFPLYTPMDVTSAALTIGPACSKRAWLVATTRSKVAFSSLLLYLRMTSYPVGPLAIVFFTVIVFCFFFIFPSPSPPPLFGPSCGSLMKRSPLNWKTVIKMRWVLFTSVHGGTNSTELVNQKLII